MTLPLSDASQSEQLSKQVNKEVLVGHVEQLVIYPMRSTKGIKIDSAVPNNGGLQWNGIGDRTFRLVDSKNGITLGCKLIPKLLKINTTIADDIIHFSIAGNGNYFRSNWCIVTTIDDGSLLISFDFSDQKTEFKIRINDLRISDNTEAIDCGDKAAKWFSSFVGKDCRWVSSVRTQ